MLLSRAKRLSPAPVFFLRLRLRLRHDLYLFTQYPLGAEFFQETFWFCYRCLYIRFCKMAEIKTLVRDFSRVIITLDNILIPEEKLSATPSMLDGLNSETETDLRILGCELIQTSGILLKLPQVTWRQ